MPKIIKTLWEIVFYIILFTIAYFFFSDEPSTFILALVLIVVFVILYFINLNEISHTEKRKAKNRQIEQNNTKERLDSYFSYYNFFDKGFYKSLQHIILHF